MQETTTWLTVPEATHYLKIKSRTTLYTIAKKYGVRQTKLISLTYFNKEDIDRVMNENAVVWQPNYMAA